MNRYSNTVNSDNLIPVNTFIETTYIDNSNAIRVIKDKAIKKVDEATYAKLLNIDFHNGTIELQVLSRLLPDAPEYARGFIGVAFRIDENDENFEALYIRPTNGRSDDQIRRNHSTQYFSYPNYKFDRFRTESPEKYESYADMGLNEWIDMKIEVKNSQAMLYLHGAKYPALIVNDLKHGADKKGAIGFWVEVGTEGFFRNLKIKS